MGRDVGEILITSGVAGGLFLAILATIDPGEEVVFLDPYFVMYKHMVTMAGGKSLHGGQLSRFPISRRESGPGHYAKDEGDDSRLARQSNRLRDGGIRHSRGRGACEKARSADRFRRNLRAFSL